jgi:pimeloyl-ACP methyl ester carboxylesterase
MPTFAETTGSQAPSPLIVNHVRSTDGTVIAYERSGHGPPLVLVDGALCSRAFGPSPKLAPLLARYFTVYAYDRRGRGQSGDTQPYSPSREVEDIAALVQVAGGSACLLGLSSGGALALEAVASGVPVTKVVAYEPPYVDDSGERGGGAYEGHLTRLLAEGKRSGAVKYFMQDMVGAPGLMVMMLRLMPWIWRRLEAVAHTLPYDAAVMTAFRIPRGRFASITVPALVMNGAKTDPRLREAARVLAEVIPAAHRRELTGQTHNVKPDVLAPAVTEFLTSPESGPTAPWLVPAHKKKAGTRDSIATGA